MDQRTVRGQAVGARARFISGGGWSKLDPHGMGIQVGNAPVSWAVYEAAGTLTPFAEVLEAIARAGYAGTELGPYGFLPTDPAALGAALSGRGLRLASSYLSLPLEDPQRREASIARAVEVARLLSSQGVEELIVADDEHADRVRVAGRVRADAPRWTDRQWSEAMVTLGALAHALRREFGMRLVVHHHAGTFIESPEEIDRLLAGTTAGEVDLLLDTGHCVYGGGDPVEVLDRHGARVRYVHFKDMARAELDRVQRTEVPYRRGVFCSPGEGILRFGEIVDRLRRLRYRGWVIVEHDTVPDERGQLSPDPAECARQTREYLKREFDL